MEVFDGAYENIPFLTHYNSAISLLNRPIIVVLTRKTPLFWHVPSVVFGKTSEIIWKNSDVFSKTSDFFTHRS